MHSVSYLFVSSSFRKDEGGRGVKMISSFCLFCDGNYINWVFTGSAFDTVKEKMKKLAFMHVIFFCGLFFAILVKEIFQYVVWYDYIWVEGIHFFSKKNCPSLVRRGKLLIWNEKLFVKCNLMLDYNFVVRHVSKPFG